MPHRVGADLAGEIDLDRGVDRHHPLDLADGVGVVRAVAGQKLHERIVVDEVVEPPRAADEARHDPARADRLAAVGDHAGLDERDDAVGEHLGVDAEVAVAAEPGEDGVGDAADAELQAGAVLDESGHVVADPRLDVADGPRLGPGEFPRGLAPGRKSVARHGGSAVGAGHAVVDLREHERGRVDGGSRGIAGGAQRAEAMAVGWRELDDRGIEPHASAREEARDIGKEDRHEVGPAGGDRLPQAGAGEERHRTKAAGMLGGGEGERALEMEVPEADVGEVGPPGEGLDERRRGGGRPVEKDVHAAAQRRDDGIGIERERRHGSAGDRGRGPRAGYRVGRLTRRFPAPRIF